MSVFDELFKKEEISGIIPLLHRNDDGTFDVIVHLRYLNSKIIRCDVDMFSALIHWYFESEIIRPCIHCQDGICIDEYGECYRKECKFTTNDRDAEENHCIEYMSRYP